MFADDPRGFVPKNSHGVMEKYCANCHQHLDRHGFRKVPGALGGSVRSCPETCTVKVPVVQESVREVSPEAYHAAVAPMTPMPAPYGTEYTEAPAESYVRVRKVSAMTPTGHLGGSSCTVVNDPRAHDFIPVHISGRGHHSAPKNHLVGAAAHSEFDELEELNKHAAAHKPGPSHLSHLKGSGLIPQQ